MERIKNREKEPTERYLAVIRKRFESGYPYIMFIDTVNRNAPDCYRDMKIHASNLCVEIALPSSLEESFVCCLLSMNLERFDSWKDTDAVEVAIYFLDSVIEEYIRKTEHMKFMEAPRRFAIRHRALGLGTLGYHSYLQKNGIPFESLRAKAFNITAHKMIRDRAEKASKILAATFGEPEVCRGTGRRNTTLMAIAPTTSSSFILGQVSPSIEPLASNYFTKDLAKGSFTYKNPYLEKVLDKYGKNTTEVWLDILVHGGSVQHLDFLTQNEKDVFKTFSEISPMEVIIQAADRQKYIDQSQSLNLMIHPSAPLKDVNELIFTAWKLGVKGLYYQRGTNPAQEAVKNILSCAVCEA
jgi:ribonucleoside-diphosphate reductase alpha chain